MLIYLKLQEGVFMQEIYFNVASITFAMKSEKILKANSINCKIIKTPSRFSSCGCGYSIVVNKSDADKAKSLLNQNIELYDIQE